MRTKHIYTLAILLALSISTYAQNFKEGYITTQKGEKVMGLIDFSTDKNNVAECRFKATEDAPVQIFTPNDIESYRFVNEGKYYVSREISINEQKRQVFLEYLVQGIMNLYYYVDPKDSKVDYYFFEDKNGEMTAVTKKPNRFNGSVDIVDNRYKGQLSYLFREFPEMSELFMEKENRTGALDKETELAKTKEFGYNRSNMIEAVKFYHQKACTTGEPCLVFSNNSNKHYLKFKFSAYAGMQLINFKWNMDKMESVKSLYPVVGVIVNLSNPRLSQAVSLYLDASLSGVKGENEFSSADGMYSYNEFSGVTTSWKLGVQYMYSKGKIRPSIGVGYGIHAFVSKSNTLFVQKFEGPNNNMMKQEMEDYYSIPSLYNGFNANIACDYMLDRNRSVFLGISYENVSAKADYDGHAKVSMKQNMAQVKVGFRF